MDNLVEIGLEYFLLEALQMPQDDLVAPNLNAGQDQELAFLVRIVDLLLVDYSQSVLHPHHQKKIAYIQGAKDGQGGQEEQGALDLVEQPLAEAENNQSV